MANNGRITTGSLQRLLQYGLDEVLDQDGKSYEGKGSRIFKEVKTDKAFWEAMQMAGTGMASIMGEGSPIQFDSIDQHYVHRAFVYNYGKAVRITRNALKDNVYENLMPRISREMAKSLLHARDQSKANVLINAFSGGPTYGDGKVAIATDHPVQAGGTNSNRLASDEDLSEAAIENLKMLVDNFVNDDGLRSEYNLDKLVVPTELQFEAKRILKSDLRYATSDNDANILKMDGVIKEIVVWKRLSDPDAYFATTDASEGLLFIRREGIYTEEDRDYNTHDTIVSACERYGVTVGDHRGIVGCPGG